MDPYNKEQTSYLFLVMLKRKTMQAISSHNKEIGDWHDLRHLAGVLQSSKGKQKDKCRLEWKQSVFRF